LSRLFDINSSSLRAHIADSPRTKLTLSTPEPIGRTRPTDAHHGNYRLSRALLTGRISTPQSLTVFPTRAAAPSPSPPTPANTSGPIPLQYVGDKTQSVREHVAYSSSPPHHSMHRLTRAVEAARQPTFSTPPRQILQLASSLSPIT
jgi:hypothetical protein